MQPNAASMSGGFLQPNAASLSGAYMQPNAASLSGSFSIPQTVPKEEPNVPQGLKSVDQLLQNKKFFFILIGFIGLMFIVMVIILIVILTDSDKPTEDIQQIPEQVVTETIIEDNEEMDEVGFKHDDDDEEAVQENEEDTYVSIHQVNRIFAESSIGAYNGLVGLSGTGTKSTAPKPPVAKPAPAAPTTKPAPPKTTGGKTGSGTSKTATTNGGKGSSTKPASGGDQQSAMKALLAKSKELEKQGRESEACKGFRKIIETMPASGDPVRIEALTKVRSCAKKGL